MVKLDEAELEEVKLLHDLFSDLDLFLVEFIYTKNDRDRKAAQEALAELASNPSKLASAIAEAQGVKIGQDADISLRPAEVRLMGAGSPGPSADTGLGSRANSQGLATLMSETFDPPQTQASGSLLPSFGLGGGSPSGAAGGAAWDMTSIADTLANVGGGISEGITSLATNITGWVADLASAFDAGWGDDEEEEEQEGAHQHARTQDKNAPSVGIGGALGIERPYQRRGAGGGSMGGGSSRIAAADTEPMGGGRGEEEDDEDTDSDDFHKDD